MNNFHLSNTKKIPPKKKKKKPLHFGQTINILCQLWQMQLEVQIGGGMGGPVLTYPQHKTVVHAVSFHNLS